MTAAASASGSETISIPHSAPRCGCPSPGRDPRAAYAVLITAAAALILLPVTPVLLAVAMAVKLDGGPVFFRQTRVSEDGREFTTLKSQSMCVDADELPSCSTSSPAMALVGPRPALPHEVARYYPLAQRRLAAKLGLTGLWQVSGRSN